MPPAELGKLLGRLTLVSSVAAVASGFVADGVVGWTGTFASPFGVSGACLVVAGMVIGAAWKENSGGEDGQEGEGSTGFREAVGLLRRGEWREWRMRAEAKADTRGPPADPSLLMLLVVNTVVETTMYLWVALWVPSLQDTLAEGDAPLPLGRVFSSFMAAMSLGSLLYNAALHRLGPRPERTGDAGAGRDGDERAPLLATEGPEVDALAGRSSAAHGVAFHAKLGCALLVFSGESR